MSTVEVSTPTANMSAPRYTQYMPPCAGYDRGEDNDRLAMVWAFVASHVGGGLETDELGQNVAGLYEIKGDLVVATREDRPAHVETLFVRAWVAAGGEPEQHVEFLDEWSDRWQGMPKPDGFLARFAS